MIFEVIEHSVMITGFVFTMMLLVEYINIKTKGAWNETLKKRKWGQYFITAILGAAPGCLGAFTVVALYSHRIVTFGSLVTAMIATSGDEAFLMFAMFPMKALILTIILFVTGIAAGFLTDRFISVKRIDEKLRDKKFPLHDQPYCGSFHKGDIIRNFRKPSSQRMLMLLILAFLLLGILFGRIGHEEQFSIKVTIIIATLFSLFVVITVPEHFLAEHLWDHIIKKHIGRIFLWAFGTLVILHLLSKYLNIESWIIDNKLTILLIACLVGLIPQSGPHLVFITLFISGTIPFYILIASSIVQDGHGMLPMLAESKRSFIFVKIIKFVIGLLFGLGGYLISS